AFLAVQAEDKDADGAQVPAGDGEALAVRTEGRHAAALPDFRRGQSFLTGGEVADVGLVVLNKNHRFAVGRPARLGAFGDEARPGAVAVHLPDFGKAAAQRGVEDLFAVGRKARVGVGFGALGELLRIFAAG